MKPVINAPIPTDFNAWLKIFPGLKAAYDQLKKDIAAGVSIVPAKYYKLAGDNNPTGHKQNILDIRMSVFIWIEIGLFDIGSFSGLFWSHGDHLLDTTNNKNALVIIGTNKNQMGALIYKVEEHLLAWVVPSDEILYQKVINDNVEAK